MTGQLVLQVLVPFLISLYDWAVSKRKKAGNPRGTDGGGSRKHFNYVLSTVLLVAAGLLTDTLKESWQSSSICSLIEKEWRETFLLQLLSASLDAGVVLALGELASSAVRRNNGSCWQTTTLWGVILLVRPP